MMNSTDDYVSLDDYPDHSSIIMKILSAASIVCDTAVLASCIFPHLWAKAYIRIILYITFANLLSALV